MTRLVMAVVLAAAMAGAALAGCPGDAPSSSRKKVQRTRTTGDVASATGCVDERPGTYVLIDEHNLQEVAELKPEGFPGEALAKYLGQKVKIRGHLVEGHVWKVRSIETIADTCAPAETPQRQR
jgi:hypothetical protein